MQKQMNIARYMRLSVVTLLQEPLPEDPAWWELFKVSKEDMYAVARQVHALFSMPKVQYISAYRTTKLQSPKEPETAAILVSARSPSFCHVSCCCSLIKIAHCPMPLECPLFQYISLNCFFVDKL